MKQIGDPCVLLAGRLARRRIEHFRRNPDGTWTYRSTGADDRIVLTGGSELVVNAVYDAAFQLPANEPAG